MVKCYGFRLCIHILNIFFLRSKVKDILIPFFYYMNLKLIVKYILIVLGNIVAAYFGQKDMN